jgi:hypothetical protein
LPITIKQQEMDVEVYVHSNTSFDLLLGSDWIDTVRSYRHPDTHEIHIRINNQFISVPPFATEAEKLFTINNWV